MGGGASSHPYVDEAAALEDGKSQEEIDAYKAKIKQQEEEAVAINSLFATIDADGSGSLDANGAWPFGLLRLACRLRRSHVPGTLTPLPHSLFEATGPSLGSITPFWSHPARFYRPRSPYNSHTHSATFTIPPLPNPEELLNAVHSLGHEELGEEAIQGSTSVRV